MPAEVSAPNRGAVRPKKGQHDQANQHAFHVRPHPNKNAQTVRIPIKIEANPSESLLSIPTLDSPCQNPPHPYEFVAAQFFFPNPNGKCPYFIRRVAHLANPKLPSKAQKESCKRGPIRSGAAPAEVLAPNPESNASAKGPPCSFEPLFTEERSR